tara:strand:+ start:1975 stop:4101 length:2127 start_codon:yes stop_codon:yes gene_type:complete
MAVANTLESNYWFGAQGNRLWVGQVEGDGAIDIDHEDLIDKQENNRVKVRIMGYHARDRQTLPPKDLPWATVMMPTNAPQWHKSQGAIHGLGIGAWVIGTFMDGESAQQPLVFGSLGVVEKGKTYGDVAGNLGLSNNYEAQRIDTVANNKPAGGKGTVGPSGRGLRTGKNSNNDTQQLDIEKITFSVSNGKCGHRPEAEFQRILGELFDRKRRSDVVGDTLVDKVTGKIFDKDDLTRAYVSRLQAVSNGILGDIKQVILYELKKFFQENVITPLTTALNLSPEKNPTVVFNASEIFDTFMDIVKCLFDNLAKQLLGTLTDMVNDLFENLLNAGFCVARDLTELLVSQIGDGIQSAIDAVSNAASIIESKGSYEVGFSDKLGDTLSQFCNIDISCYTGTGEYTTKEGDRPDTLVTELFNRVESFGDNLVPNLFGDSAFFKDMDSTRIKNGAKATDRVINCSKANSTLIPAFPSTFFTGWQGIPGTTIESPRGIPAINHFGEVVAINVTNGGNNLKRSPSISVISYAGYGDGATAESRIKDGKVKDVVVTKSGGGYPYFDGSVSNNPLKLDDNGDPLYDEMYGIDVENPYWIGIITFAEPPAIFNAGYGLTAGTKVCVKKGKKETGNPVLPEFHPILHDGRLTSLKIIKEGFGFTAQPEIFLCGEGDIGGLRSAVIVPVINYVPRKDAEIYITDYAVYKTVIDCVGHPGD